MAATESRTTEIALVRSDIIVPRLDPFDCREPGRCAVVMESRVNTIRLDGSDVPSSAWIERRSQLFPTDGVRPDIGTLVTEAQHIQRSIVLGHRRKTRHVSWSLVP